MKELNKNYYKRHEYGVDREEIIRQLIAFKHNRKYDHVGMIMRDPVRLARRVLSKVDNTPEYLRTILGIPEHRFMQEDVETEVVDTPGTMYSYDVLRKALAVKVLVNGVVIRTSSMGIRRVPISDLY